MLFPTVDHMFTISRKGDLLHFQLFYYQLRILNYNSPLFQQLTVQMKFTTYFPVFNFNI